MDYTSMTVAQLRIIAKEKGVNKATSLKKQQLLDALKELEEQKNVAEIKEASAVLEATAAVASGEKSYKEAEDANDKIEIDTESMDADVGMADASEAAYEEDYDEEPAVNVVNEESPDSEVNVNISDENGEQASSGEENQQKKKETTGYNRGDTKEGILEIMPEGYGFIRNMDCLPSDMDVYVGRDQIRKMNLRKGDLIVCLVKQKIQGEKFNAMLYCKTVNGLRPYEDGRRPKFENLTPIFPHERIKLETPGCSPAMRIMDIMSPIGKGQRGMIVSQPKAGKTTLLKQIANAITTNNPEIQLLILLIDERPEEVTDIKESIEGENVTVIYSTFDETPDNHKRVAEIVIERAKRMVEQKKDVVILLDSITRLARAYNLTCAASGRTLSGGLDPAALHMPKKFFGAARCMREGGSLTILATALVETGSRMDDVVFEEFKGTGNMELVLDRNLSEKRIFPAINLPKSSTRRDDLLLTQDEQEANEIIRHAINSGRPESAVEKIISVFARTRNNKEFCGMVKKTKLL